MLFQIESMWQILGWCLVFAGLIITNEIARRTKKGGVAIFGVILGALTVYFIVIAVCAGLGMSWALKNQTRLFFEKYLLLTSANRHREGYRTRYGAYCCRSI